MNNVFKPIKYLSMIMLVVIISAVITYIVNPNFSDTLNSVSSNISKSVSQKSGLNLVVAYIFYFLEFFLLSSSSKNKL